MTKSEKRMWQVSIENTAAIVAKQYGNGLVNSVFQRYGAYGIYDLSPQHYGEVFAGLEQIINDN